MLAFELSMPSVNTWNGRWSGEDDYFAVTRSEHIAGLAEAGKSYGYNFGHGWYATVRVRRIDGDEARKVRRRSKGFCGYEWMVTEIIKHGRILPLGERVKRGRGKE